MASINLVARLMKWIILVNLILCALLFLPDQVREFYRITVASSLSGSAALLFWIISLGAATWMAANQIATEAETQITAPPNRPINLAWLAALMGTLPILTAAVAQLYSIPEVPTATTSMMEVGSIIRIQASELGVNATRLRISAALLAVSGISFGIIAWIIGDRSRNTAIWLNDHYFSKGRTLLVTAALIVTATTAFVAWPVSLPQKVTMFGVIAVFTLCLCSFVLHITLVSDRCKTAFIPIILAYSTGIAAFGWNDNHTVRQAKSAGDPIPLNDVSEEFVAWLARADRTAYAKARPGQIYPVFIVAAQGGGAYAAYNSATFLARLQDLCPTFRHHLFAISSVSGGSVGSAAFAAALDAEDNAGRTVGLEQINSGEPCPQVTKFLAKERAVDDLGKAGVLEQHTNSILGTDFLSPLVAAALFPDFTQSFIPWPVGPFDRARALEYAFETSGRSVIEHQPNGTSPASILEENYFSHWSPQRSFPALLFNATDAGTGKRVVISPFRLTDTQRFKDEVCLFANSSEIEKTEIDNTRPATPETLTGLPIPLSTAAFVSARFPWVTPAATVRVTNPCFGSRTSVRLVDGGYLDNSGVETALGLITRLRTAAKEARKRDSNIPEVGIHLISLTGGDFPTRTSYAFNDALEPIRALLSGRETRAYIALNRASATLIDNTNPSSLSFKRTDLRSMFYRLPLGWSLSQRTRNIISHESGRFWDCESAYTYNQTRDFLSNSDCIQLHVNFLLKGSLSTAIENLKQAEQYRSAFNSRSTPTLNPEALLSCYETWWDGQQKTAWETKNAKTARARLTAAINYQHQYFSFYQTEQIRDLLQEWSALPDQNRYPNMLAFVLASLSVDTQEFRRAAEFLSFESVSLLNQIWGKRLGDIDDANRRKSPPLPPIDRSTLLNNPVRLAQVVWSNRFGNHSADDTWNYRARGLFQIVGREQYQRFSRLIGYDLLDNPDAVWNRRASARIAFAHYLNWVNPETGKKLGDFVNQDPPDWRGARGNDTEGPSGGAEAIAERAAMFLGCIGAANTH